MLVGAISLSGTCDVQAIASELAKRSCSGSALRAQRLWSDGTFACLRLYRDGGDELCARVVQGAKFTCVSGNVAARETEILRMLVSADPHLERVRLQLPGHWAGLRYDRDARVLQIFTDRLGVGWTFVARTRWGYLFGPNFGALVSILDQRPTPDHRYMLVALGLRYGLGTSTCYEGVQLLPAAALWRIDPRSVTLTAIAAEYPEQLSGSMEERMEHFGDALEQAAETWIRPRATDLDVSLSAGFDCRYGLALVLDAGRIPRGFTFGNPNSGEVRRAQAVAELASVDTEVFPVGASSWSGWRECVQRSGSLGGFHWPDWLGWLRFLGERSRRVLIGFLGDAVSGKLIVPATADTVDRNVEAWLLENLDWPLLSSEVLTQDARRDVRDLLRSTIYAHAETACYSHGHQAQMHLDWYGRQRRFVAAQPNLMSQYVGVVPFLYEPHVLSCWARMPLEDLVGQRLYREYAARRFPYLFAATDRRPGLAQRLKGSARNALARLGPEWRARFAPPVLDPGRTICEQKQEIIRTAQTVARDLSVVLDVERVCHEISAFPCPGGLTALQVRKLANLALLFDIPNRPMRHLGVRDVPPAHRGSR